MDARQHTGALVIAAAIIAAVRLKGEERISRTPRVLSTIADCVQLARMILHEVYRAGDSTPRPA